MLSRSTICPGVRRLLCDGMLSMHSHERRVSIEFVLASERRDRGRLQSTFQLDIRDFGLPRSWRYGVWPMNPVVTVFLDAVLQREARGN